MDYEHKDYWKKYIQSDEIQRHTMLEKLPCFRKGYGTFTPTLLQSYLDDLLETAIKNHSVEG